MTDAKQKFFLLKQSKYFCAAPWGNMYLETDGEIKTCCVGSTSLGNIKTQTLHSILNGKSAKEIRKKLLNDQPHPNCKVCYEMDQDKVEWLRLHYNDLLKSSKLDLDDCEFNLGSVDLRWSNTCNFACVYCVPKYSNRISAERNIPIISANDSQLESVLEFVIAHQDDIKEIYLAGGEPLLMKQNLKFLSTIKNKKILLRINTNLSNLNKKNPILDVIKEYSDILWTISIDNADRNRFEYIRYGSDWNTFVTNLHTVQTLGKIRFNMVYFIGNAMTIDEDIDRLLEIMPTASFSLVPAIGSEAISACNLPGYYKQQAREKLDKIQNLYGNIFAHDNIQNCQKELNKQPNGADYQSFFDTVDGLHSTDWRKIFPELNRSTHREEA